MYLKDARENDDIKGITVRVSQELLQNKDGFCLIQFYTRVRQYLLFAHIYIRGVLVNTSRTIYFSTK